MLRRAATAVLLSTLALGVAAPSYAAPKPSPSASASPSPSPSYSPPPVTAEAKAEVQRQAKALSDETAQLVKASQLATETLQAYQQAQREAEQATQLSITESIRATTAAKKTERAQRELLGYVGSLYRTGMVDSSLLVLTDALASKEPQQLFGGLGLVKRIGTSRSHALDGFAEAQAEQIAAAEAAQAAAEASKKATLKAAAAKAAAAKIVASYQHQVVARRIALAHSTNLLNFAELREANLEKAYAVAYQRGWVPDAAAAGAKAGREATCVGGDVTGYPNGMIALDALCPLWGVRGHRLRADAAAAFNEMSKEYATVFGAPICVTDSYRSFDAQILVKEEKPELAATPGASNHGWGLATDLCDGIQGFGSPQHTWMDENSMRYGWFHPPWAQAGGGKPEPWHWEYAG
jgi:hypothetical protein